MPYIKKEMRPPFDEVIDAIKQKNMDQYVMVALDLALEGKALTAIDGCINYLFSKLLKDEPNPYVHKKFIKDAIKKVYLSPIKYYKLNRLFGLFECMIMEFDRRGWGSDDTIDMFKDLQRYYRHKYITYEKQKIEENGDI